MLESIITGVTVTTLIAAGALAYSKPFEFMSILQLMSKLVLPFYAGLSIWLIAYYLGARHAFDYLNKPVTGTNFNFTWPVTGLSDIWLWAPAALFFAGLVLVRLMLHIRSGQ